MVYTFWVFSVDFLLFFVLTLRAFFRDTTVSPGLRKEVVCVLLFSLACVAPIATILLSGLDDSAEWHVSSVLAAVALSSFGGIGIGVIVLRAGLPFYLDRWVAPLWARVFGEPGSRAIIVPPGPDATRVSADEAGRFGPIT